ncbi:MAG: dinitrogenase iron-molybdenum cofactor biosynthesis protein [Anaerolineae bacterium]|nr:dinitrogenase iron-molybdenum cofactor biosynthesis protein [Anaerolineae bacterium]
MKIAVITDDGTRVSQHFGRSLYFSVLTIEEGKVVNQELREKPNHSHFSGQHLHADEPHEHRHRHGQDEGSHRKHTEMAHTISDCQALLCGGMGRGAYTSMIQLGITPIVTDIKMVDEAAQAYIEGKIIDRTDKLH